MHVQKKRVRYDMVFTRTKIQYVMKALQFRGSSKLLDDIEFCLLYFKSYYLVYLLKYLGMHDNISSSY